MNINELVGLLMNSDIMMTVIIPKIILIAFYPEPVK